MNILKGVRKNFLFFLFLTFFLLVGNSYADEFSDATNIINSADTGARTILGTAVTWLFGLFLPIICIGTATYLGYRFQKQKAEQEQSSFKLFVILLLSAVIGFFVFAIVTMFISSGLMGDSKFIFEKINEFWRSLL